MRIDLYTKMILTIIMLLLGVLALRPLARPTTTAQAGFIWWTALLRGCRRLLVIG